MARVAGVNIPTEKHVEISLTYIYGIWKTVSQKILGNVSIERNIKVKDLTEDQLDLIREEIKKMASAGEITVEWDLRRLISQNIRRLIDIGSYRGSRHKKRLPVRWQRTKTNARTRKWKAVSVASKKK